MGNLKNKIRNAKIYFASRKALTTTRTGLKFVPQIRIEGNWLQDAGFAIGDNIEISAENGADDYKSRKEGGSMTAEAKQLTDKQLAHREKRKQLIDLSAALRMGVKEGIYDSVNEALKEIYAEDGHEELNTFGQWLKEGYCVRKGEKALLLWGSPRKNEQGAEDEDDMMRFWPMCYVFSNLQVDPVKK